MLAAWEGTPYVRGWQLRGEGADCLRYVLAAIDELRGRKHPPIRRRGSSTALHSPAVSQQAMREALIAYWPAAEVLPGPDGVIEVQPADVVVQGHMDRLRPAHAMMVGGVQNHIWHCTDRSVRWTGMTRSAFELPVIGAWRLGDVSTWTC